MLAYHYFFRSFVVGQEKEAIQTVMGICNDIKKLWDEVTNVIREFSVFVAE